MTSSDWEERMSQRSQKRSADAWARAEAWNLLCNDPPEPSEEEVRRSLPPRSDENTCAHGLVIGDNSDLEGMAFAAGFMHCVCCERDRPYLNSGVYSSTGASVDTSTDEHLCYRCGGKTRTEVHGIPEGSTVFASCDCSWKDRNEVPATKESDDPRISYENVTKCAACDKVVGWTVVWFAKLA